MTRTLLLVLPACDVLPCLSGLRAETYGWDHLCKEEPKAMLFNILRIMSFVLTFLLNYFCLIKGFFVVPSLVP